MVLFVFRRSHCRAAVRLSPSYWNKIGVHLHVFFFSLLGTQFCVHTDKQKMLQQLTRDINQHPKKVRVMYELVKSVAAGKYFIPEDSTSNVDVMATVFVLPYIGMQLRTL